MGENRCKHCTFYLQHYILNKRKLVRIYAGHCTNPKVRNKKPDSPACDLFVSGTPDEDAFVCKEYLSKELLQYLLHLELLPEIEDRTTFI